MTGEFLLLRTSLAWRFPFRTFENIQQFFLRAHSYIDISFYISDLITTVTNNGPANFSMLNKTSLGDESVANRRHVKKKPNRLQIILHY